MRLLSDICEDYLLLLKKEGKIKLTQEQISSLSKNPVDQEKIKQSIFEECRGSEKYQGNLISSKRAFKIYCTIVIKYDPVTGREVYNFFVRRLFNLIEQNKLINLMAHRGSGKSFFLVLYVAFKSFIIDHFQTVLSFHIPEMRENWFNTFKEVIDENEYLLEKKEANQKNMIWGIKKCIYNKGLVRGLSVGTTPRSAHPNLIITDDILGKAGQTKYPLRDIENYILGELYPIIRRKKARMIVCGTPVDDEDVHHNLARDIQGKYSRKLLLCTREHLFYNKDGWACIIFPAILNFETKEVLLSDEYNYEELMRDKSIMGDFKFYREIQCEIKIDKSALISHYLFTQCYDDTLRLQETGERDKDGKTLNYVMFVDPSAGEGENPDYAAIAIWEILGVKKILRYIWHERLLPIIDPNNTDIDLTHEVMKKYKDFLNPRLIVENNNIGRVLIQNLRKHGIDPEEHDTNADKVQIMMDSISELKKREDQDKPNVIIPHHPECGFTDEAVHELKKECLKYGLSKKTSGNLIIGAKGGFDDLVTVFLFGIHYCLPGNDGMPNAICV